LLEPATCAFEVEENNNLLSDSEEKEIERRKVIEYIGLKEEKRIEPNWKS